MTEDITKSAASLDDLGRSIERAWNRHDRLAKRSGSSATPPGRALFDRMVQPLTERIIVERRDEQNPAYEKMVRRVTAHRVKQRAGAEIRRRPLKVLDAVKHLEQIPLDFRHSPRA